MKVNYINKTDVPKRKYTKWTALIDELMRSESEAMELVPEDVTDVQIVSMRNALAKAIRREGAPIKVRKFGPRIYMEKVI